MDQGHVDTKPPIVIPFFPEEIANIPRSPLSPDDPDRFKKALAWQEWRLAVIRYRIERRLKVDGDATMIQIEMERCRRSFRYWLSTWCFIFEPRNADNEVMEDLDLGEDENAVEEEDQPFMQGDTLHWIPFDRQIEMVDALERSLKFRGAKANVVVSKAREVGASWLVCAWVLWKWLFAKSWTSLLLSRNEEYVESADPKSLFWKIMFIFDNLPKWMIPIGFVRRTHKTALRLRHPDGRKFIVGETANRNAGRGNRVTFALMDEAAFFENFNKVWAGLVNSTRHVAAVSSESLEIGDGFTRLAGGEIEPQPTLFPFEWWECPYHLDDWLNDIKERFALEPWRFDQEVLRNARAGNTNYIYSQAANKEITPYLFFRNGNGPLICGIDPGQRDNTALIWAQDAISDGHFNILESYQNTKKPAGFYGSIMNGVPLNQFAEHYGVRELELMDTIRNWGVIPSYYGDTYGMSSLGASTDSFYDVLWDMGIQVNPDRTPAGKMTATQNSHRFRPGRREALRQLIPRMEFADSQGARAVWMALRNHRFAPVTPNSTTLSDEPVKDDTVHLVSALEYIAVNIRSSADYQMAAAARSLREGGNLSEGIVRYS